MSKSVGYYTACPEAENLVKLYGDKDLDKLPQIDQAGLLVVLSLFIYYENAYPGSIRNFELACLNTLNCDDDYTTDEIQGALTILENISKDDAIGLLQFLLQ